jgi:D-sedoheptulose 7-phosphate isomerase
MLSRPERAAVLWPALIDESIAVRESMRESLLAPLEASVDEVVRAIRGDAKLLLAGNGGSAADAQHIAAEFVGRFRLERQPLPAIALSENVSSMTGIGNDYSFEIVFSRQLQALAKPGDVLIALSTSGRSTSIVRLLESAPDLGVTTIAITGPAPNPAAAASDIRVVIEAPTTASIQEGYMLFLHALCQLCEEALAESCAAVR